MSTILRRPVTPTYSVAMTARDAGISVVPIMFDGTKQPSIRQWRQYQQVLPSVEELTRWFADARYGLAVITGKISGNLEALDFDDGEVFQKWLTFLKSKSSLRDIYERVGAAYEEVSPAGGRHFLYFCDSIEGSRKLAMRPTDDPNKPKTLAETRGQNALLIIDPSRGTVHRSGKPYRRVRGGIGRITRITSYERDQLLQSVRVLNEIPAEKQRVQRTMNTYVNGASYTERQSDRELPGTIYNQRVSWSEVLCPHGWTYLKTDPATNISYWTKGIDPHATTNFNGNDRLKVFSTATAFETDTTYSKFGAYAVLNHGGDTSAASRELYRLGYRKEKEKQCS